MIPLKSEKDLEMMRKAGKILARIMKKIEVCISAGVSTSEIDRLAEELMQKENVLPALKG